MANDNPSHLTMERRLESRGRMVAWLALTPIIALPFLHHLGISYEWSYPKLLALQTAVATVWIGLVLVRPVRIQEMWSASGVGLPMLLILAWAFLSIGWSEVRWAAAQPLVELTTMALAVVGFANLFTVLRIRRGFLRAYGVAAPLACLAFVVAHPFSESPIFVYPFANANIAASFALMPLVVGAAYGFSALTGRVSKRYGLFGLTAAMVAAVAIVVSRSAAGAASGVFGVALVAVFATRGPTRRIATLCLVLLLLATLALPVVAPTWLREELGARPAMWSGAMRLAAMHPIRGLGIGSFFVEYARVYPVAYAAHRYHSDIVETAHSVPLHMVVELGLVGAALALWLCLAAGKQALQAHGRLGPGDRTLLYGLVAGALAMLAQGAVSTEIHHLGSAIHLVLALALLGGLTTVRWRPVSAPHRRSQAVGAFWAVLFAVAYAGTALPGLASQFHLTRAWTMPAGRPTRQIELLRRSIAASWPNLSTLKARYRIAEIYETSGHYEAALAELRALDTLAPNIGRVRASQARVLLRLGRIESATQAIIAYCRKDPLDRPSYQTWTQILHAAVKAGTPHLAAPREALRLLAIAELYDTDRLPQSEVEQLRRPFTEALRQAAEESP